MTAAVNYEAIRQRLLKSRYASSNQVGIWRIFGEDQSYGGQTDRPQIPHLGKVQGTYEQAIEFALRLPDFVCWGFGGTIVPSKRETIIKLSKSS